MPQVTVYVRNQDIESWKSVVKKSEFIHNALHNLSTYDGSPIALREEVKFCKHNAVKGMCKKGCK